MIDLSDEQLLLLDMLIYIVDFNELKDKRISDIIPNTISDVEGWLSEDHITKKIEAPNLMSRTEWLQVLRAIQADDKLMNLVVDDAQSDDVPGTEGQREKDSADNTGFRAACLVDGSGNAVVVFRGTGVGEWFDVGMGAIVAETEPQRQALEFVNKLEHTGMVSTGHSNGGNEAQYVTVMAGDKIQKSVSFDGQGFSNAFITNNHWKIKANAHKIHTISAGSDIIGSLLYQIANEENMRYIDTGEFENVFEHHKPNVLVDEDMQLRPEGEQGDAAIFMSDLSKFVSNTYIGTEYEDTMARLLSYMSEDYTDVGFLEQLNAADEILGDVLPEYFADNPEEKFGQFEAMINEVIPDDKAFWRNVILDRAADRFLLESGGIPTPGGTSIIFPGELTNPIFDNEAVNYSAERSQTDLREFWNYFVRKKDYSIDNILLQYEMNNVNDPAIDSEVFFIEEKIRDVTEISSDAKAPDTSEIGRNHLLSGGISGRLGINPFETVGESVSGLTVKNEKETDIKSVLATFKEKEVLPLLKNKVDRNDVPDIICERLTAESSINPPSPFKKLIK